jgi:hypothetical protein
MTTPKSPLARSAKTLKEISKVKIPKILRMMMGLLLLRLVQSGIPTIM